VTVPLDGTRLDAGCSYRISEKRMIVTVSSRDTSRL
jgi:hypothetical protein